MAGWELGPQPRSTHQMVLWSALTFFEEKRVTSNKSVVKHWLVPWTLSRALPARVRSWLVAWLVFIVVPSWAQPFAVSNVPGWVTSSYSGLQFFIYLLHFNLGTWHKLSVASLMMLSLWPSLYLKSTCHCYLRCCHCLAFWPKCKNARLLWDHPFFLVLSCPYLNH